MAGSPTPERNPRAGSNIHPVSAACGNFLRSCDHAVSAAARCTSSGNAGIDRRSRVGGAGTGIGWVGATNGVGGNGKLGAGLCAGGTNATVAFADTDIAGVSNCGDGRFAGFFPGTGRPGGILEHLARLTGSPAVRVKGPE